MDEILEVLAAVGLGEQPLVILAKTLKGAGISFIQDKEGWHGKPLNKEEAARAIAELQPRAKTGTGRPDSRAEPIARAEQHRSRELSAARLQAR